MIKYYGNQIWNNCTRNSEKLIIYIAASQLSEITSNLDSAGLNYYAYKRDEDTTAKLAINKDDLEHYIKLDSQERYTEAPRFDREIKTIIGNTAYRNIKRKKYVSYKTDFALKLAEKFTLNNIPFSGRIARNREKESTTTLTFEQNYAAQAERCVEELKKQREVLNSLESTSESIENNILNAVAQKLNYILSDASLKSPEQLKAIEPAVEIFMQKYDDDTFVEVFANIFADTASLTMPQLNEIALKFAEEYKDVSGLELLFVTSVIPGMKDKFAKEAKLLELTDNQGYSQEQIFEIKKMIDNNISESIINLIDYTFTPEQISKIGAAKNYSDIISVVAEAKHTSARNISNYIRYGTYIRETPTENTITTLNKLQNLVTVHKNKLMNITNERNTIVINAFAGPGAGKTTSCLEIAEKLKKQGYVTEYVQEYAKELVWDNQLELLDGSIERQFDILQEQLNRVDRLYGKVDFIVTDSPVLLNATYLQEHNSEYIRAVQEIYSHFDNFNYFVERDVTTFENEGRIHNLEQSLQIDQELKDTLSSLNLGYSIYNHSTIDNIVNDVIEYKTGKSDNSIEIKEKPFVEEVAEEQPAMVDDNAYKNEQLYEESASKNTVEASLSEKYDGVAITVADYLNQRELKETVRPTITQDDIDEQKILNDFKAQNPIITFYESLTEQNLSDANENSNTALQTEQKADDIAFSDKTFAEKALQENEIESAPSSISNLFQLAEQSPDKPQEKISSIDEYTPNSYNDDTNFVITDDNTVSGAKTKFRNNINAIKTLKALEMNGKAATNADKKALSLYTGWGGLAPAFSENHTWKNEAQELRDLLNADEYVSARASSLDAFYTDNTIIDGIYQALRKFGFTGGDVLEPAMGIGNFFGRLPADISRSSNLYGVEKDSLSGRIASKLYPDANITIDGFENTQFQNGSFDIAVGNIPFGDFSINDKEYNSQHLKIHDYFFLKTLDKVRPGGIVAFVTSKGTLDKKDTSFRKSLAERADLLGAVRLPNNAFKSAGTEVTSDIIFLQKRTVPPEKLPEWVQLSETSDGLSVNQYFASHPDMVLGKIVQGNKMYGRNDDTMCIPFDDADLSRLLPEAINKISGRYTPDFDKPSPLQDVKNQDVVLPENIRQESYFLHNGELYFWGVAGRDIEITHVRELWANYSTKNAYKKYNNKNIERTKTFVELREIVRELLEVQKLPEDYSQKISELQKALNEKYDAFYSKFGLLHGQQNRLLLSRDSAYPLLLSLEAEVDKGKLVRKSDIFTERTISPPVAIEHVDTALEALNVSIVNLGEIDLDYMSELCDIPKRVIVEQLRGQIYPVPELSTDDNIVYQTASEYLSGDIYKKLDAAKAAAEANPLFEDNIPALKDAIPTTLKSGDIDVNIGATWIEPKYYQQFIYEMFETPDEYRADIKPRFRWQRAGKKIEVEYSKYSNKWQITNKSLDKSVTVTKQLGTQFKSAYSIFESVLNLNDPRVYKDAVDKNGKIIFDKSGNPVRVLDVERTKLLQQKANIIKRKFKDWIFKDPQRRSELVAKYNREFNCIKPREFDGSHLTFPGMNSSIELRSHQKNAIAHAIFGGNTLFAHSVGAGKTFEMIATAMECKRLGFCHKSLFAVPNHLTEQIGADFLKLYPGANILVATAKDFTKANRKQLMSKIATGNYDAVIIGHSQLKNLPLSPEIQKKIYQEQIDDIIAGIAELKESNGSSFQVKAMERTRKSLQSKLDSLDTQNRDNTVYFDELGIDKLFVDEAHEFKNLFSATKLQNISGISSRASQRATDLFAKCRYLDEKTGGKGVVFATGTPVSNSITEMHTMMRYLQYDFLASHNNMQNFDNWVSTFGKIKVDYELAPAGNKFKERSRVAEYSNMPELMSIFKQIADIRPADTLHLAVPECSLHIVNTKPTELQQSLVAELSARADDINAGKVDPSVDNMLKITGDGRKVGLDPRLINPDFEDNPETKLNRCVANVLDIYNETAPSKLTQLIFCDLGVPKKDKFLSDSDSADDTLSVSEIDSLEESGAFSVYQDIKDKLIASGVPEKEIAFIHDAHTEAQKAELFYKVRNGDVRILLGSTAKMGTGTNVQNRLVALHDLDVPWRPSDLEQRRGRMVRQGNINKHVDLYRYVTEGTFDAYSYQLLEKKQRFIGQIMTSKTPARRCTDIDQEALTYSEIKALCTGDERIKEKLTLENRVKELEVYRKDYINNKYELEDKVAAYPAESKKIKTKIEHICRDIEMLKNVPRDKDNSIIFSIKIGDKTYTERTDAAKALAVACKCVKGDSNRGKTFRIGEMYGFPIELKLYKFFDSISATLVGNERYTVTFSDTMLGNLRKLENGLAHLPKLLEEEKFELNKLNFDFKSAQELLKKPFEFEEEYQEKTLHLERVTEELNTEARELIKSGVPKERTKLFGKKSILSQSKSASKDTQNKCLNNSKKRRL
ncbi:MULTISPECIES: AAA family ATPase [unclassified Ruminococcus]|uniref:AAA family ATPase n=1 Tax=unclassified Ruminococcus TaxID=2608920 RepID=UPI00210DEDB2|nr:MULTISPECIES: AAA family ATPase [unclassified Ruminococcus]MCQ4021731.1 AAA family ATPase [Ruminococcus sp. zg-924]MCQ4114175.1 AAA family ATPase [Ruminococcus sp. zg-921]